IYVDNMEVVQFGANGKDKMSSTMKSGRVTKCKLEKFFLEGGKLYRYRYGMKKRYLVTQWFGTCTTAKRDPPEVVLHRANFLLQQHDGFGEYHLFQRNCEDFALYCKTGKVVDGGASSQVIQRGFGTVLGGFFMDIGLNDKARSVAVEDLMRERQPITQTDQLMMNVASN
ncbi:PREDICTED: uncharacterized protein LOC104604065, partial [Nelumbo nucifera]